MSFNLNWLGVWTEEVEYRVTPESIAQYATATNDTRPANEGAPPLFAVVPALIGVATVAKQKVWHSEVPGYDTRSVHGEQDCRFEGAIRSGMVLRSRAAVAGVHPRSTGTLLVTKTETRDDAGSLRNQLYFMSFLRGVSVSCGVGERPPERLLPADRGRLVAEVTDYVAEDQSLRYAEASGDYGSYHVDETAARAAGFPSVIVHGLCTMAFACRAVVAATCGEEPHRLNRFAVRFSRPLLPGQMVTTTIWHGGHRDGRAVFAVELADAAGRPVITQGLAEVRQ